MNSGWGLALSAAVTWGVSGFLAGQASRRGRTLQVLLATQLGGLAIMLLITGLRLLSGSGIDLSAWVALLPFAAVAGVAELVGFTAMYRAMSDGPMGIAAPVAGLGVAVPVLVGVSTGAGLRGWQVLGLVLAAAGILVLTRSSASSASRRSLASAGVAGAAFGIALVALAQGAQLDEIGTGTSIRLTTVPVLLVAWIVQRQARRTTGRHSTSAASSQLKTVSQVKLLPWVGLALIAGIFDALGNLLFALASTRTPLSVAAIVGSLDPVVTAMLARIYLAEQLHRDGRWGVAAAVLGAALTSAS